MLPRLHERDLDLLISYTTGPEEAVDEAIVNAFLALDVDVFDRPTQLVDWVDVDAIETLEWSTDPPLYVSTRIWDYRVVVTGHEVRIYTPMECT